MAGARELPLRPCRRHLFVSGALEWIDSQLQHAAPRLPNDIARGSYFGGRTPEDGRIDWSRHARDIHNLVRAVAQDTRSQARNRELALERLRGRLESALTVPRQRRATKPTAAARRRRVDTKRRRGELKRLRGRPADDS